MITKKHRWRITEKFIVENDKSEKLDVWEYTWVIEQFKGVKRITIAQGVKEYKTPQEDILELQEDGSFILKNEIYRMIR